MSAPEREFDGDLDERDLDDVEPAETPKTKRRVVWMSRTVMRNGEGITLDEVISVDDDADDEGGPVAAIGGCKGCGRSIRGPAWWCSDECMDRWLHSWTAMMRPSVPSARRWAGAKPWEIGREWFCQACGQPIVDVKSKGRPPRFCDRDDCRRARQRSRQSRHRNGDG